MTQEVDILVLGGHDSGKTCFMLAMYDDMRLGRSGFTFSTKDVDLDRQLVSRFRTLMEPGSGRWPKPNQGIDIPYVFNLNYAFRLFMRFRWYDYRGNIISEPGEEYEELKKIIEDANIILIAISGDHLFEASKSITSKDIRQGDVQFSRSTLDALRVGEINGLFSSIENRPSIVALVTKSDLFTKGLADSHRNATIEELPALALDLMAETVFHLYTPLTAKGGDWRVFICPVSLGKQLAVNRNEGEIKPINMHRPVMFAFYEHAREVEKVWQELIKGKESQLNELRKGWFTKNRTRSALSDLEQLKIHRDQVLERLHIVKENIGEYIFLEDGNRVELL